MTRTRALILAGGRSSRFNGIDKTFAMLAGRPLIEHVFDRIRPQVDAIAISSNVNPERFAHLGVPVIADIADGVAGPLAGIRSGLARWPDEMLLSVAVDLPFLPDNLVARLVQELGDRVCAYATDGARHSAALLWAPGAVKRIGQYLETGKRDLRALLEAEGRPVIFPVHGLSDITFNVNTRDDLAAAEQRIVSATPHR